MTSFDIDEPDKVPDDALDEGLRIDVVRNAGMRAMRQQAASRLTGAGRIIQPSFVTDLPQSQGQRSGASGGSSSGGVAAGDVPPAPQRDELVSDEDTVISEENIEIRESAEVLDDGGDTTETTVQQSQSVVKPEEDIRQVTDKSELVPPSSSEHFRSRVGLDDDLPTEILGDARFSFEGDGTTMRPVPSSAIEAIRRELTRLGAPGLAQESRNSRQQLSSASLVTALIMSALDVEIDGVDENTRRAAEVLRTSQGRLSVVETKVGRILDNQDEERTQVRRLNDRSIEMAKRLYELELMVSWLITDRVDMSLNRDATPTSIELAHQTVINARADLRAKAKAQREREDLARGRGRIIE